MEDAEPDRTSRCGPARRPPLGLVITQLIVAVLGALTITGEYSTGLIRTTLAATPARGALLAAKAAVLTATILFTGTIITLTTFALAQAILSAQHIGLSIGDAGVARGLAGTVGYLVAAGLIGLCLGTLVRHTGGALAVLVALLFLAPEVLHGTAPWLSNALPGTAIRRLVSLHPWPDAPSIPLAAAVVIAYPAALLFAARLTIQHRDT